MNITIENIKSATAKLPVAVFCMDGRMRPNNSELRPFIGLAGSGVLWDDEYVALFVQKLKDAKIDTSLITVTWHEFCGACNVFKSKNPNDNRSQNEIAQWGAERLATALGSVKPILKVGWSENCDIAAMGNPDHHSEPAIIIDGTGKLDTEKIDLDNAFLLSHAYAPDGDWMQQECDIALNIAMGEHGPGKEHFTQNPMPVYIIGNDKEQAEHNHEILSHVFENHKTQINPIKLAISAK
jgi:hypothetical protein